MKVWAVARHELQHKRWGLVAYSLGAIGLVTLYVSIYPTIHEQAKVLEKVFQVYPKSVLQAFNLGSLTFDTLEKYLAAEQFSFIWPIMGIALVLGRAGSSLAGEIEQGTMGLLLGLPIGRWRILAGKYLAGWIAIGVFSIVSILGVIPIAAAEKVDYHTMLLLRTTALSVLFLGAVFSLGVLASVVFSERSRVYALVSGLLVIMYVMDVVARLDTHLSKLRYESFFHYFNAVDILDGKLIQASSLWVFGGVIVIATALAVWRFQSRDIAV